jgi:thiosulfate/3-mercaptopyruvate sulfurtransferase
MSTISTAELREGLDDPRRTVVDIRPLASYNGWRRNGDARGGHIRGAVAFPAGWLQIVDEPEVRRLLDEKGITADRDVVVYGDGPDDATAFVAALAGLGVRGARAYEDGATAWAADPSLPLERLPNYEKLVHIPWLRDVLDGVTPEAPPNEKFLLFHVNFGVPEEYAEAHIPGALYLDTNWLEDPVDWNRRSPEVIEAALRSLGITTDTTVVVYGRDTEGDAKEKWPGQRPSRRSASRSRSGRR